TIFLSACQKDVLEELDINVTTPAQVYSVDDSVEFFIEGDADMITFYSGENGSEYRYKDRTEIEGGNIELNMEPMVLYGIQEKNLSLMMSTNFNGDYSKGGIEQAVWIDISDRFTWSTSAAGGVGTRVISDYASVQDLLESQKPLYFALKYRGNKSTTGSAQQRTWRVYQFNVQNRFSEELIVPVMKRTEANWTEVTLMDESQPNKGKWLSDGTMTYYMPESNLENV